MENAVHYRLTACTMQSEENIRYAAFGIEARYQEPNTGECSMTLWDISTYRELTERLVTLFNQNDVAICHFKDVVLDMIS